MVALYTVGVLGDRRRTVWTGAVAAVVSGAVALRVGHDVANPQGLPVLELIWPLVPLLLGEAVRTRRELLREYEARAARAKAALVAGLMYGLALVSCALAVAVGGVLLPASYPAGEALPALFGIAGSFAVAGLLGLAVGTLVRHSAGAVTTVIGLLLLPSLFGPLFGGVRRWIAGLSPTAALVKLTQTSDATAETVGSLGPWPSLWLVAGCTAALLLVAVGALRRRDV